MKTRILIIIGLTLILFSGCNKNKIETNIENTYETEIVESSSSISETETTTKEATTAENLDGKAKSPLTGLYIDEKIAARRPFAVTINNLPKALPQSGISFADIYYEVLTEGGITRIVAIFQDSDADKIGPVRSARHYFLDFAFDNDAIYIHHGGSPKAYSDIKKLGVEDFDGMNVTSFFYRDKVRANQKGMYEHSSYIDANKFLEAWENSKYRIEKNNTEPMFKFTEDELDLENGDGAYKVTLPYSNEQVSVYQYDKENKVYNRFQNSSKHIDELTGEQLSVKNIIIQYINIYIIDNEGRRDVDLIGSGDGIYITNGKSIPIKWFKKDHKSPTIWTNLNGNTLKLNEGKTWINVFDENTVILTEPEQEL